MVTSAVAPVNGAGTSTSATSPTSYCSRSAISSMMSSSRTGHGAWSEPLTQRKLAERATRSRSSSDSATSRYRPELGGVNVSVASPAAFVLAGSASISVSRSS